MGIKRIEEIRARSGVANISGNIREARLIWRGHGEKWQHGSLTISVLQACCAVTTEYGIPSNFVRKSTASLQIKISTAKLNFSNRNVIIF